MPTFLPPLAHAALDDAPAPCGAVVLAGGQSADAGRPPQRLGAEAWPPHAAVAVGVLQGASLCPAAGDVWVVDPDAPLELLLVNPRFAPALVHAAWAPGLAVPASAADGAAPAAPREVPMTGSGVVLPPRSIVRLAGRAPILAPTATPGRPCAVEEGPWPGDMTAGSVLTVHVEHELVLGLSVPTPREPLHGGQRRPGPRLVRGIGLPTRGRLVSAHAAPPAWRPVGPDGVASLDAVVRIGHELYDARSTGGGRRVGVLRPLSPDEAADADPFARLLRGPPARMGVVHALASLAAEGVPLVLRLEPARSSSAGAMGAPT